MNKKRILIIIAIATSASLILGISYTIFSYLNSKRSSSSDETQTADTTDETQEEITNILDRLSDCVTLVDLSSLPKDTTDYSSYKSYYVSTTGDDSNDGTQDLPFATISHALEVASERSIVFVRGGNYKTTILRITHSNFALTNYEDEEVTLTQLVQNDQWNMNEDLAILIDGDLSNVVIDGITIENFEEGIIYGDPATQENIVLKNINIRGASTGIGNTYPAHTEYLIKDLLIKNVTMTDMTGIGLHCGDEQQPCAQNVLVQNVKVFGASDNEDDTGYDSLAMVNSDNILVIDSTFTNAPGDALDFKATRVSVVNSIAAHPNRNGIKFWHEGEIINCISYATGADANIVFGSETHGSTFRMVNSVIAQHLYDLPQEDRSAYAMTIGYDTPLNFNVELVNNIFYDMPGPIYINSQSSANIRNNIFYDFFHDNRFLVYGEDDLDDITDLNQRDYADSNQYIDPQFSDPTLPDWTLLPNNPATDTGTRENNIPDFDIDWQDRPRGSEVDIGPYEG